MVIGLSKGGSRHGAWSSRPGHEASATSASGSVTIHNSPYTLDIDAVLNFPASDAGPAQSIEMKAQGVDLNHGC